MLEVGFDKMRADRSVFKFRGAMCDFGIDRKFSATLQRSIRNRNVKNDKQQVAKGKANQ